MKTLMPVVALLVVLLPLHAENPAAPVASAPVPVMPGPVAVPAPTNTVKMRPELAGKHPRLFFTDVAPLKTKIADTVVAPVYASFLSGLTGLMKQEPPAGEAPQVLDPYRSFGDRLPKLALAYLLSGDPQYLAMAKRWMAALSSYASWNGDTDLVGGHVEFGLAVAYDWLYSSLSEDERKPIEAALLRHGRLLMQAADPMKTGKGQFWGHGYYNNHNWICQAGITAAAMALYDTNPQEMQTWLDYTRSSFQPTYTNFGSDGANHEGISYASYGTTWMLYYMDALRNFSGEDLTNMPYLKKLDSFFIYGVMPNDKDVANFEDCPVQLFWEGLDKGMLYHLAAINHDGHLVTMLDRMNAAKDEKKRVPCGAFAVLWIDPTVTPAPLDELPLHALFPDYGLAYFRTGWDANAAVVGFRCGPPGGQHLMKDWASLNSDDSFGHDHPDANSFAFWSGGQWRIGMPAAYTMLKETHNENTWTVAGLGQGDAPATWPKSTFYQNRPDQPRLLEAGTAPQMDYVIGEAGPAYAASTGLISFRRTLVFMKGATPYVVIYDLLTAKSPTPAISYLHSAEAFTVGTTPGFRIEGASPTVGLLFGSGPLAVTTKAFTVQVQNSKINDQAKKEAPGGFELAIAPNVGTTTWTVTVIGQDGLAAKLARSDPRPAITIGSDRLAWDEKGRPVVNHKKAEPNLLAAP